MTSLTFWKIMAVVYGVLGVAAIALSHWAAYLAGKASMLVVLLCFALPALATVPAQHEPPRDTVDVLETNNFYDLEGRPVFRQLIGWAFYDDGQHHVVFWRLHKSEGMTPVRDHARGDWFSLWQDGQRWREVRARSYVETWTQHDPEATDREFMAPGERRGLSGETPIGGPQ